MADLRIVDAPVLLQESITDDVKMPTGGLGNYAIRLGDLVWYVVAKEDLASKSYVDTSSKGVQDKVNNHVANKNNPHEVTKVQVGLGNVDNTADIDKPVSNATKMAIITATTDMATKTYVNDRDGDLATLTTTDKTSLVKAINEVVSVKANKDETATSLKNLADNKADKVSTYTKKNVDDLLLEKVSNASVFTKDEIDSKFAGKANKSNTLSGYGIQDAYTKSDVDTRIGSVSGGYFKAFETLKQLNDATGMVVGQVAKVMNDVNVNLNGDYHYTDNGWVKGYDNYDFLNSDTYKRQQAYETIKPYINPPVDFNNLTSVEKRVFDFVKNIEVHSQTPVDLSFAIIYSNSALTTLNIGDGTNILPLLNDFANVKTISDNGKVKTIAFTMNTANKATVSGKITFDYSPKSYSSFAYNLSAVNPNLKLRTKTVQLPTLTSNAEVIKQRGLYELVAHGTGTLLQNSLYMTFFVDSPFILDSVSVEVVNLPSVQPSWIECTIYPPDNGYGTAERISSSDQIPIYQKGTMRLPLERKVMQKGRYTIGFKTNAPSAFAINYGLGVFARGYDATNTPMPKNAPNLSIMDKYGFFPSFALHEHKPIQQPVFPAKWALEYKPELLMFYSDGNTIYYIFAEGLTGSKTIYIATSTDGGNTITKYGVNITEQQYALFSSTMHGIVRYVNDTLVVYLAQGDGRIVKGVLTQTSNSFTDISPPNRSTNDLHSYAPLVIWKGFLWWGEYGNPEAPKIHKMDLGTEQWYVSIQKPLSGATGARHVHFLYASPYDKDVLWANWGDASNGGGQGLNKLTITDAKASPSADNWVQWSTGVHDDVKTTLPYPTGLLEIYEPANGKIGSNEIVMIGAGDQPPTHLIVAKTKSELAGKALFYPLNFKRESAPKTETCHWLTIDDEKTIYYMVVESNPQMSIYASPYPYTDTYQISKYWQQALAGAIYYAGGYIHTRNYRFPKIRFKNALDNADISKVPHVADATTDSLLTRFNELLQNLRGSGVMQYPTERSSDKNQSAWFDSNGKFENFGQY